MSKPLIVRVLRDRVLKWERALGGVVIIKPSSRSFSSLEISKVPIGFLGFERKTQIICTIDVLPEVKMNEKSRKVYRRLKEMECDLAWKGALMFRRPFFTNSKSLEQLAKTLPEFQVSSELIDVLNLNQNLISLVKMVRPDDVMIQLLSTSQRIIGESGNNETIEGPQALDAIIKYYQSPERITWLVTLTRMLEPGFSYPKVIGAIYFFFETISTILRNITNRLQEDICD